MQQVRSVPSRHLRGSTGSQAATVVTINDDDDRRRGDPGDGIVVTIVQVPNGTVMSRRSTSLALGGGCPCLVVKSF